MKVSVICAMCVQRCVIKPRARELPTVSYLHTVSVTVVISIASTEHTLMIVVDVAKF